jgi:hypothetical protein
MASLAEEYRPKPAVWVTPQRPMLGSRGDLNDCLGFNVDPVNNIVRES